LRITLWFLFGLRCFRQLQRRRHRIGQFWLKTKATLRFFINLSRYVWLFCLCWQSGQYLLLITFSYENEQRFLFKYHVSFCMQLFFKKIRKKFETWFACVIPRNHEKSIF